jgi:hypothetical protein
MALYVDYDQTRWIYVPNAFPWSDFADEEAWAAAVADVFDRGPRRKRPPRELLDWLRAYLTGAVRGNTGGAVRFVHLPTLESPTLVVDVYDTPADASLTVADLTRQDEPGLRGAAQVDAFTSPHLGAGTKAVRILEGDGGSLIRATTWVWRTPELDVVMLTGTTDLPVGEAMDPILDDLARSIRLAGDAA